MSYAEFEHVLTNLPSWHINFNRNRDEKMTKNRVKKLVTFLDNLRGVPPLNEDEMEDDEGFDEDKVETVKRIDDFWRQNKTWVM